MANDRYVDITVLKNEIKNPSCMMRQERIRKNNKKCTPQLAQVN